MATEPSFEPLVRFFDRRGIRFQVLSEALLLPGVNRQYFDTATGLEGSLVFLDPDIGLEVPSSSGLDTRYLHYDDLATVYEQMSHDSVVAIYQHMPRASHSEVFASLSGRLHASVGMKEILYVDMGDVTFIVGAKTPSTFESITEVLGPFAISRQVALTAG